MFLLIQFTLQNQNDLFCVEFETESIVYSLQLMRKQPLSTALTSSLSIVDQQHSQQFEKQNVIDTSEKKRQNKLTDATSSLSSTTKITRPTTSITNENSFQSTRRKQEFQVSTNSTIENNNNKMMMMMRVKNEYNISHKSSLFYSSNQNQRNNRIHNNSHSNLQNKSQTKKNTLTLLEMFGIQSNHSRLKPKKFKLRSNTTND